MPIQIKTTDEAKRLYIEKNIDVIPKRMQKGDAGHDLYACIFEPLSLYPGEVKKIPTGVCVWLGDGMAKESEDIATFAGLYLPRSSCKGLVLENTVGLLDSGYHHESFIKYRNRSEDVITINPGDRIAQLVIIPAIIEPWHLVEEFKDTTGRGEGDGSSGVQ